MVKTLQQPAPTFYARKTIIVAQELVGCILVTNIDGIMRAGRIVEVEAYDDTDPASHAFCGKTVRNAAMFGPVGHVYTYISYGIHTCVNIVARAQDQKAGGVLIRAIEPVLGIEHMQAARKVSNVQLSNGPGKLTSALGISMSHYGQKLCEENPISLWNDCGYQPTIIAAQRVGITRAQDKLWRFYDAKSTFVSKK